MHPLEKFDVVPHIFPTPDHMFHITGSVAANPKIWGAQTFGLWAINSIFFETPPLKAWVDILKIREGTAPLSTPMITWAV